MKRLLTFVFLLLNLTAVLSALTISNTNTELVVNEQNGRFSIFAKTPGGAKKALLVSQDPRTTMLTILAGSKIYRMGDSFEFRQSIESSSNTVDLVWTSRSLVVTEHFALAGKTLTITITVKNTSERELNVGIRYLLDTYLGEKGEHFAADGLAVEKETDYVWVAPFEIESSDGKDVSLFVLLSGSGITDPDRVVIANWKRLNDASWTFEANQSRDFNLLPYSINDSAIAVYYEPESIASAAAKSATFKMTWREPGTSFSTSASTEEAATSQLDMELVDSILDEVVAVDTLLLKIDRLLSSGSPPTQEELAEIRSTLAELEERRKEYSEQQ
jgi:hypothetical protein